VLTISSLLDTLHYRLEQQYWHRSVVLITNVTSNTVNGEPIDTLEVPEDQLANGDKYGRWSYRGLLLNRLTDLLYVDSSNNNDDVYDKEWKVHRGGDLLGLDSSDGNTDLTCLHMSNNRNSMIDKEGGVDATRLVGNLYYMKLEDAQSLYKNDPSHYNSNDFYTFAGFCSWRPGQLEREMGEERNEWKVLSVDEYSIWSELKLQSLSQSTTRQQEEDDKPNDSLLEAGTNMWRNYLNKVDISESKATKRLPAGQLKFYDEMLNVWAEDNLNVNHKETTTKSTKEVTDSSRKIKSGTLVRATSPPSNDMLLFEAEFIRSLILVLEDTPESTVGIVLNHVMPAAIDVKEGEEPIPLRFGGPIDVPSWRYRSYHNDDDDAQDKQADESEEDEIYEGFLNYQQSESIDDIIFDDVYNDEEVYDDDSSFIWIHRDAALGANRNGNGGSKLGMADIWLINEDDALNAIQSGALSLQDVVVFAGVCIWEKGQGLGKVGGGLREQIDVMQSLEVVDQSQSNDDVVEAVWNILSQKQQILAKETLDSNVDATIAAWEASCSNKSNNQQAPDNDNLSRIQLADAALKAWIGRSLLDDPLGTLVEVKKRTI